MSRTKPDAIVVDVCVEDVCPVSHMQSVLRTNLSRDDASNEAMAKGEHRRPEALHVAMAMANWSRPRTRWILDEWRRTV